MRRSSDLVDESSVFALLVSSWISALFELKGGTGEAVFIMLLLLLLLLLLVEMRGGDDEEEEERGLGNRCCDR